MTNSTSYNLPYGFDKPATSSPQSSLFSILIALVFAIFLMFFFMKYHFESIIRIWFFIVVVIATSLTFNAIITKIPGVIYATLIALVLAVPLAYIKVFKRNILVHNFTELLIYPGIAAIFVPWFNIITISLLIILICVYDIYAVWHSGFMQRMASYQIKKIRVFGGFLIPYMGKKERLILSKIKAMKLKDSEKNKKIKSAKIKINIAVLGGGDIVWPMILAGVVLNTFGLFSALLICLGATLALAYLLLTGEKGKPYPAMPYISTGIFIALAIIYLINI